MSTLATHIQVNNAVVRTCQTLIIEWRAETRMQAILALMMAYFVDYYVPMDTSIVSISIDAYICCIRWISIYSKDSISIHTVAWVIKNALCANLLAKFSSVIKMDLFIMRDWILSLGPWFLFFERDWILILIPCLIALGYPPMILPQLLMVSVRHDVVSDYIYPL